jgi:hypothetical protein
LMMEEANLKFPRRGSPADLDIHPQHTGQWAG